MDLAEIIETIRAWPVGVTYGVLFLGSMIEYIFPPVPGDTVVLAGAVLVTAFGWNLWPVLLIVTLGAVLGSVLDFYIGRWLVRSGRLEKFGKKGRAAIGKIVTRFQKHGPVYLAVNRFLPGIRAFFFVAAGIAELRIGAVILWSAVSALAWNGLLVAVGWAVGDNIEALETLFRQYMTVVWIILGLIAVFFIGRYFLQKHRKKKRDKELA